MSNLHRSADQEGLADSFQGRTSCGCGITGVRCRRANEVRRRSLLASALASESVTGVAGGTTGGVFQACYPVPLGMIVTRQIRFSRRYRHARKHGSVIVICNVNSPPKSSPGAQADLAMCRRLAVGIITGTDTVVAGMSRGMIKDLAVRELFCKCYG